LKAIKVLKMTIKT